MRTLRTVAIPIVVAMLVLIVPVVALAADGYRADTGSYNEEGFGLIGEYLPFTEVEYRADTGAYNEEGFGLIGEYLPYTEVEYRGDTGAYNEEGFGHIK